MSDQYSSLAAEPRTFTLPPIAMKPIRYPIGQAHCVLRAEQKVQIETDTELRTSPRTTHRCLGLSNGEKVVITTKTALPRPAEVDGVLQEQSPGSYRWLSHKLRDAFDTRVGANGMASEVEAVARSWDGCLRFRSEKQDRDGIVQPGDEGLRPPQLGGLHAIGAHWTLSHQPATLVMPTGTGKTETMLATLAAYVRKPMLVVVPSDVLRSQTARKFLTFGKLRSLGVLTDDAPNPIVGIVTKRPRRAEDLAIFRDCNVIVGTMSALSGGEAALLSVAIASEIEVLVVDEAHHIAATSWSTFRAAFGETKVLQFTATPYRRDAKLVDGQIIYSYPLRFAQRDGYFRKIAFEPIYEIDTDQADTQIATAAIRALRRDLAAGFNHILMARCANISRATVISSIYERLAADLSPILMHSDLADTAGPLQRLRSGNSRIVICVNMLGEGFDLPELKVAAVHDTHKSLAVLLQFTGRFTRSAGERIGDATVIANIADADVSTALERLYSEDADWNLLLSELSSEAARDHAELVEFLSASRRLDDDSQDDTRIAISHQLLKPTLSTLIYEAHEFRPERFHEGLPKDLEVFRVWLNQAARTLYFVTRLEPALKWTRSKELRDLEWALFVLHYDEQNGLLYLSSTDHSSLFEQLARAVGATQLKSGDVIFRTLGNINRLIFQNVGVKKHGRRNLRYAMYTGADVAEALSLSERAGSVKSNLSGTGWEGGRPITIGCSYKGRVWSREQGPIPRFVKWCTSIGSKIVDDSIDTRQIIANVLIPEEQQSLPNKEVLGLEWPMELLTQAEERISLVRGDEEGEIFSMFDIRLSRIDQGTNTLRFNIVHSDEEVWGSYHLTVGGEDGFDVTRQTTREILVKIGSRAVALDSYFRDFPPLVRFIDLTELDGNLLIRPQDPQNLVISSDRFEAWDWSGVDVTIESMWKGTVQRANSIQQHAAAHFIEAGFNVVFDDDSAGEAADLVCMKEEADHIRLALVHCKFSGGTTAGERVKDVVEVSSQAVRSAKWKWKFRDLCRHIAGREKRLSAPNRPTRFLQGNMPEVTKFAKLSRFKEIRPEILIVQPGLSEANRTPDQSAVLAAALVYLKETIGVDLDIVCSA